MSDEAGRKKAAGLRRQIAAFRKGAKPRPEKGDIRSVVEEAAERARDGPSAPDREDGEDEKGGDGKQRP